MDHIAIPKGGGRDTQQVRARLTTFRPWTVTATSQFVVTRLPNTATEWTAYAGIYDQYKVNGMRVIACFPKDGAINLATTSGTFTQYPVGLAWSYDNDTLAGAGSVSQTWGYSTTALEAPVGVVSYSIPSLPVGASYGDTTGYILTSEWTDCAAPDALAGVVTAYLDRVVNTTIGPYNVSVFIEWDVTFRGRRN